MIIYHKNGLLVVYFKSINGFFVWALSLLDTVNRKQCYDIGVDKIKKGSECVFVKIISKGCFNIMF